MVTPMCISEDGNKAIFIGTFLETGDNVRLCDECMPQFCAAVFERMTGVDMAPAIYLASQEGQEGKKPPAGSPGEVAYPPDMGHSPTLDTDPSAADSDRSADIGVAAGAPSVEPPAPAPADADRDAEDADDLVDVVLQKLATPNGVAEQTEPGAEGKSPPARPARAKSRAS